MKNSETYADFVQKFKEMSN